MSRGHIDAQLAVVPGADKQHASSTRGSVCRWKLGARNVSSLPRGPTVNLEPTDFESETTNKWFQRFPKRFRGHKKAD